VHDPDGLLSLSLLLSGSTSGLAPVLGYVGLGPGPEFIPYFLALLGVVGAALIALLQWPILTLRAYLKGKRHPHDETELQSVATDPNEIQRDANHDGSGS
jgi:hypothetical protein